MASLGQKLAKLFKFDVSHRMCKLKRHKNQNHSIAYSLSSSDNASSKTILSREAEQGSHKGLKLLGEESTSQTES